MRLLRSAKGLLVMAVVALLASGVGVPAAQSEEDPFERAAHFTEPGSRSREIVEHLLTLIKGTPEGQTIRIATYKFEGDIGTEFSNALVAAAKRGVHVQVIANEGVGLQYNLFAAVINAFNDPESFAKTCKGENKNTRSTDDHDSCFGSHKMHNKFYLFSETHGSQNVVVQSTENIEDKRWWNSSYTVRYKPLYDHYVRYFEELEKATDKHIDRPNFYDVEGLGHADFGNFKVYHAPRNSGNTVENILDNVECHGNSSGGTGGDYPHRTIVRVSNWQIAGGTGEDIAQRLWDLDNEGCFVDIVGEEIKQAKDDPTKPLQRLLRKPRPCRLTETKVGDCHGPEVREFYASAKTGLPLHEKNLMIDGNYAGVPNQKVFFTGSVNFNNKSLTSNDETWLRVYDNRAYDAFVAHFQRVKCAAHLNWQSSKEPRPWNTAVESSCPED